MNDFEYYNPTKVVFGQGRFADLGAEVKSLGDKALLVKQEGPLEQMGVYERAVKSLEEAQVAVQVLEYVSSNPKLSKIREGIALAKEEGAEVVVAVGGGSAIDAGKAIAIGAACDGDVWEFFRREREVSASLPMVAVSTISATGAETSCHVVVTNDDSEDTAKWKKWAIHDPHAFPDTAIIDPGLLVSVPNKITAAGMADTISHILEGYFDGVPNNPISDRIGEGIVMTVIENEKVLDNPEDLNARAALSWAATLAMSGLQDCGRSNAGFPAHWIQHAVGALTDSSHGEGLAVINPAWLELENEKSPVKFMQFAERVFGIERTEQMTDREYGLAGIQALKAVFKRWGLPETLRELGVTSEMIPTIVQGVMESPETYVFEEGTVEQVLRRCL
ncbi:iron-containing alcohol dehydrogenase [Extibacter muris]|uniref:iron-containing alcohol dehydrogenase n=1 Tax=Extibacter muris TaxID=1796622 RepID=UPI001D06E037|nr:iron-containing alcohol dehydrogenase [Extibacter muris]MCB6203054.1 iron-containing alcohol dehydrogenase [Extibacter muris]MCQ4664277.1 iron-containing alcohol dehydrogenase [Extibacter muris]MCQ4695192.1 iron-containing alcohol dehydrogenase [Extibacter muris]